MFTSSLSQTVIRSKVLRRAAPAAQLSVNRSYSYKGNCGQSEQTQHARNFVTGGVTVAASVLAAASFSTESACDGKPVDKFAKTAFFPKIQPYEKGLLKVSDIHSIAYSVYGNPKGKPVLVVHGGPGGGTSPDMARYFDPKVYKIVLVDQRGCGDSVPFANLVDNTTYDSVRDFEKVREKLGIQKWQLFGGSWGSTLALAYAIEHPDRVTELVLRGIFLLRDEELKWMYQGRGANFVFPEAWEAYEAAIPANERHDYIAAYGKRLRGEMGEKEKMKAAIAWSVWEGAISKLVPDAPEELKHNEEQFALAFARIENHYFTNKGFFPRDGFLLEKANLDKIRHLPTSIVQGRYDVVCPAVSAHHLHKALPHSELTYTLTGHSGMETEIIEHLVKATEKYKHR